MKPVWLDRLLAEVLFSLEKVICLFPVMGTNGRNSILSTGPFLGYLASRILSDCSQLLLLFLATVFLVGGGGLWGIPIWADAWWTFCCCCSRNDVDVSWTVIFFEWVTAGVLWVSAAQDWHGAIGYRGPERGWHGSALSSWHVGTTLLTLSRWARGRGCEIHVWYGILGAGRKSNAWPWFCIM